MTSYTGSTSANESSLFHASPVSGEQSSDVSERLLRSGHRRQQASSRHLRSVNQHQLTVPRCRRITLGCGAFSVAGMTVWNSLPTEFRDLSVGFGDIKDDTIRAILVQPCAKEMYT